ncbi:hypothetical protein P6709_13830 [Jeotgalibacillus sp. ET6]|uniref:hypothetical protein n=1 Tax=Jeotgalibacillus sp. ET6 TaxID=3037260 RepID=UPI002418A0F0|nr:hypothetical protein [Jeotgalibacillus sp. ET6]MDG5472827.1 hypothetical protein [Jeotgalibacillus sp. ET6]
MLHPFKDAYKIPVQAAKQPQKKIGSTARTRSFFTSAYVVMIFYSTPAAGFVFTNI